MTGTDETNDTGDDEQQRDAVPGSAPQATGSVPTDDGAGAEPKGGRPGPTGQGKDGGMATREVAPDIAETEGAQEPPD